MTEAKKLLAALLFESARNQKALDDLCQRCSSVSGAASLISVASMHTTKQHKIMVFDEEHTFAVRYNISEVDDDIIIFNRVGNHPLVISFLFKKDNAKDLVMFIASYTVDAGSTLTPYIHRLQNRQVVLFKNILTLFYE